jgi:hypothetical protein
MARRGRHVRPLLKNSFVTRLAYKVIAVMDPLRAWAPPRHQEDQAALAGLRAAGARLLAPRLIRHQFRFSWEDSAQSASRSLASSGYLVEVSRSDRHPALTWQVDARGQVPLTAMFIDPLRTELEQLARLHGGVYDGWYLSE